MLYNTLEDLHPFSKSHIEKLLDDYDFFLSVYFSVCSGVYNGFPEFIDYILALGKIRYNLE